MKLNATEKLALLAEDSRYDLACACGTSAKDRRRRQLDGSWLYPVPLAAGGYGIMLKTLLSNACSSDCRYCPLRHDGVANRCALTPDETAQLFMDYLRKQWLVGIFLSSGIVGTPDHTMELLTDTAAILRRKYRYRGFIHLKVIPGASEAAILRALSLASAVSLNIEAPGARYFSQLSSYKNFERDIVRPLKFLAEQAACGDPRRPVRCSTQFIVGAADEPDRDIVRYTGAIYRKLNFDRVYFSAYQPPKPTEFRLDDGSNDARLTREPPALPGGFPDAQLPFRRLRAGIRGGRQPRPVDGPEAALGGTPSGIFPGSAEHGRTGRSCSGFRESARPTPTASSPAAARCGCGTGSTSASKARRP